MKRVYVTAILTALCMLAPQIQAQDKKAAAPMMDAMAVKKKMMEPEIMMATEKAMMSDKSMVPSMMAKEMMMHDMMKDEKNMSMVQKATMAEGSEKPMMMDETKMKMAGDTLVKDSSQLQMLFQELVARHLASQKMAMMAKAPAGKAMTKPMKMDDKSMMDGKKEMMNGDAMATMMVKETMLKALLKDPDVLAMVEKQAKMMQEPAMAKMISDENMMMKSEAMGKDPAMMKGMMKDAMVRHMSDSKDAMKKETMKK